MQHTELLTFALTARLVGRSRGWHYPENKKLQVEWRLWTKTPVCETQPIGNMVVVGVPLTAPVKNKRRKRRGARLGRVREPTVAETPTVVTRASTPALHVSFPPVASSSAPPPSRRSRKADARALAAQAEPSKTKLRAAAKAARAVSKAESSKQTAKVGKEPAKKEKKRKLLQAEQVNNPVVDCTDGDNCRWFHGECQDCRWHGHVNDMVRIEAWPSVVVCPRCARRRRS